MKKLALKKIFIALAPSLIAAQALANDAIEFDIQLPTLDLVTVDTPTEDLIEYDVPLTDDSVEYHNGFAFPHFDREIIANGRSSRTDWYCDPYQRTVIKGVADIDITTPGNRKKFKASGSASYASPFYYRIENYTRVERSANGNRSFHVDLLQRGQETVKNYKYEELFSSLQEFIFNLDLSAKLKGKDIAAFKADLLAKMTDFLQSYQSLSIYLSSTHDAVLHTANASGQGATKGRSWYKANLDLNVVCAPKEALDIGEAEDTIIRWIEEQIEKAASDDGNGNGDGSGTEESNLIPVMTSNFSSGIASTSGDFSGRQAFHAFDDSNPTAWLSALWESPAWLQYEWGNDISRKVTRYEILFTNGSLTSRAPRKWELQGAKGYGWVTLDSQDNQTNWAGTESRSFAIQSPDYYKKYRLLIHEDNDSRSDIVTVSISKLSLFGQ